MVHRNDRTNVMRSIVLNKQRIRQSSYHPTPHISCVTASAPRQCQRRVILCLKPAFIPQHAHLLPPSQSHSQSASPKLDVRPTCSYAALPPSPAQRILTHIIFSTISSTCGISWPSPGGALRGHTRQYPSLKYAGVSLSLSQP